MRVFLVAPLAFIPNIALAHPGHMETVSGHAHTWFDLLTYGVVFAAIALLALRFVRAASND